MLTITKTALYLLIQSGFRLCVICDPEQLLRCSNALFYQLQTLFLQAAHALLFPRVGLDLLDFGAAADHAADIAVNRDDLMHGNTATVAGAVAVRTACAALDGRDILAEQYVGEIDAPGEKERDLGKREPAE